MNKLRGYVQWLRRIGHCRGFGVQSPSAYRFIRYVVNEHYPYYAYADLRRELPDVDWLTRKRMELYFRVANYRQAAVWTDFGGMDDTLPLYVQHGCNATRIRQVASVDDLGEDTMEVMRIRPVAGCDEVLAWVMAHADDGTLLIIEDIGCDDAAGRMWQTLLRDGRVSVSYDLYYLGMAFFDGKRIKQNYVVNF